MTLTAANIFTRVLDRLGPLAAQVTSIEEELKDVLLDLTEKGDFVSLTDTVSTADGVAYADITSKRIKYLESAAISGGNLLELGTMQDYQKSIAGSDTPTEGEPTRYFLRDGRIYLYDPIPDGVYAVNLFGYKYHADSTTPTLVLDELYRKTITEGVLAELFAGKLKFTPNAMENSEFHRARYEMELEKRRRNSQQSAPLITYRDI